MSELLTRFQLNNKQIIYKELKLKQYKIILKCLIAEPIDVFNLILNLNNILEQITNLTREEIFNLNLLEYLLLLTEIRTTSIGSSIFAVYKTADESIDIEIPLKNTLTEIQNCLNNFKPLQYKDSNTELNFIIPKIKDILDKKEPLYIKESINSLPVRYLKKITSLSKQFNKYFKQYYFFNPIIEKYSISLSVDSIEYIELLKILFNENLISVYENIFYLSKICNMSSEYLENCTYGEFKIFVKKTEEMLYKNVKQSQPIPDEPQYEPVDINSLYGNEDLNITRSEFTP